VTIHNVTAYVALAAALVHPAVLLLATRVRFRVVDLVYPVGGPKQPWINTTGALALYLLVFVVVTSYFRWQIGRRWWKRLHYTTYALFPLYAVHSLLTDPTLRDAPIDYLDGEKVYVELCVLAVAAAAVWRVRWQQRQPPPRVHRPKRRQAAVMAVLIAACCMSPSALHAQAIGVIGGRPQDSSLMAARISAMRRDRLPANVVLRHRTELRLTPAQVKSLEALVAVESEADRARLQRMVSRSRADLGPSSMGMKTLRSWSGPIDEAALRADARRRAELQADELIEAARERRTAGAVLTPEQRAILERLDASAVRRP
jgi:Spy/CpxP family protein refolding chaperone